MKLNIHIAFFIPNLSYGGVQSMVLLLAKEFKKLGNKVTIFGFNFYEDEFLSLLDMNGINYVKLDEFNYINSKKFKQLDKISQFLKRYRILKGLKKYDLDVIFSFTSANLVFSYLWRITGAKQFLFHDVGGHPEPLKKNNSFGVLLLKWSKPTFVVNSFHCKDSFSYIYSLNKKNVHVIRQGIENKPIEYKINWKRKLNLSDNCIVILMMANFFKEKDHITVIKSFHKHLTKYPLDSKLIITGIKINSLPEIYEECIDYIKVNNLTDKIQMLGHVEDKNVIQEIADIGILSSKSEGSPTFVMEMMLKGKTVIGSNIPGIKELINNDDLLFEVGNIEQCERLLSDMILNKERLLEIGQKNHIDAKNRFTIDNMISKYLEILK